jgi:hypothetical protein
MNNHSLFDESASLKTELQIRASQLNLMIINIITLGRIKNTYVARSFVDAARLRSSHYHADVATRGDVVSSKRNLEHMQLSEWATLSTGAL